VKSLAGLLGGLAVATAIIACGPKAPASDPNAGRPSDDLGSCRSDDDCILVDQCCDCNNGGGRIAIRKDQLAHYKEQRTKECSNMACAAMISQDGSCNAEASCRDGRCSVSPHLGDDTHGNPRPPM
jgi:hypothetical protein